MQHEKQTENTIMETNVTKETAVKVKRWIAASKRLANAQREKNSAETELSNARNELGKFLIPEPAKDDEAFNIWFGSGIIQATKIGGSYSVCWRKEMSPAERSELGFL